MVNGNAIRNSIKSAAKNNVKYAKNSYFLDPEQAVSEIGNNAEAIVPLEKFVHKDGSQSVIVQVQFKNGVKVPEVRVDKKAGVKKGEAVPVKGK